MLVTKVPSFPLENLHVGKCSLLLEFYKKNMEKAQNKLEEQVKLLDKATMDLLSLTKVHEESVQKLAKSQHHLQEAKPAIQIKVYTYMSRCGSYILIAASRTNR